MRKPHPSYEMFIEEQKSKYGKTFLEWYAENQKFGDVDLLPKMQENNKFPTELFIKRSVKPIHRFYVDGM
jgi:hypothetical protein